MCVSISASIILSTFVSRHSIYGMVSSSMLIVYWRRTSGTILPGIRDTLSLPTPPSSLMMLLREKCCESLRVCFSKGMVLVNLIILFLFCFSCRYSMDYIRKAPNNESAWNYLQGWDIQRVSMQNDWGYFIFSLGFWKASPSVIGLDWRNFAMSSIPRTFALPFFFPFKLIYMRRKRQEIAVLLRRK